MQPSTVPTKRFFVRVLLGREEFKAMKEEHGAAFEKILEERYQQYRRLCISSRPHKGEEPPPYFIGE